MGIFLKVNGRMIKLMVMVCIYMLMELNTRDTGKMIFRMDTV